jgi:hypothetical protein
MYICPKLSVVCHETELIRMNFQKKLMALKHVINIYKRNIVSIQKTHLALTYNKELHKK